MKLLLVITTILFLKCSLVTAAETWTENSYPDPLKDRQRCGVSEVGGGRLPPLCDPDKVLTRRDKVALSERIRFEQESAVDNGTFCESRGVTVSEVGLGMP